MYLGITIENEKQALQLHTWARRNNPGFAITIEAALTVAKKWALPIEALDLTAIGYNLLVANGTESVGELIQLTGVQVAGLKKPRVRMTNRAFRDIKTKLAVLGLALKRR